MSTLRRYRRVLSALAILALCAKAAVGVALLPDRDRLVRSLVAEVLGPMILCSTHATEAGVVDAGEDRQPDQKRADHCPVCTLLHSLAATVLLVALPLWFGTRGAASWPASHDRHVPTHAGLGLLRSRGPPLPT